MASIRRVRTASGATAVQVVEYAGQGRNRVIKHFGSAHTLAELGVLMAMARDFLTDQEQGELDFDAASLPRLAAELVPRPAAGALAEPAALGQQSVARIVEAPRVVATASRLLYDVVRGVYTSLGFDAVGDVCFRDLVIARIVEPTSLLDADRVLISLGASPASYRTRRRMLERCYNGKYRDQISRACFTHARGSGDVSLLIYDVTTLYFEADKEDGLRKVGYSKERRVDPQVIVGLLVDRHGFPLEIGCWEGNKAEQTTIIPIIRQFQARHHIAHMVVAADAGMLSQANLTALDAEGFYFIVGSRQTKAPIDLESHFRWNGTVFADGQIIDTLTPRHGANHDNNSAKRPEPVWDKATYPGSWRAIWQYSHKRYLHDVSTLRAQEERARAVAGGDKTARRPRFVTDNGGHLGVNETALQRAKDLAGLKGYVTNLPATLMPAADVISNYHDEWNVEQSFRMSKHDLRARPMFQHRRQAIEAHLTICFAALAISREIQNRTGITIRRFLHELAPLRSAFIQANGVTQEFRPKINTPTQTLITKLMH